MTTLAKVKDSFIEKGKLIIKVLQYGAKTAKQAAPFGIDSNPLENFTAIYSETTNAGEAVILGYINKNHIAGKGEIRIYSQDDSGEVKAYAYARSSGVLELNGGDYSAVRFQNLKTQIDLLQEQINSQLPLIASGILTGGGAYTPTLVSIDLSNSESATVKLK